MSVFALSQLSAIRSCVGPTIQEHRNARVPSLDPTKGPFRAFRALRLTENEGNRSLLRSRSLCRSGETKLPMPTLIGRGRIKTYSE